jgi:peroxiredoxin Q/BCP
MTIQIGDPAPDFTLLDQQGNAVTLSSFLGKTVILYFYPRDNTPGCTTEACGFRDIYSDLLAKNVLLFGISTDDQKSHQKFIAKYNLPFPLLCDPDAQVATAYDSYGQKKFMGKEYMGIIRNTIVIDPEGKICKIYRNVKPAVHPTKLLADLSP